MSTISTALVATCLALASFCATAQTAAPGAPPTHPATGGSDETSTPSPTTPPTHPAIGTSGATPEIARKQNPVLNSSSSGDVERPAAARSKSKPARAGAERNSASTDSMAKDKMKNPASESK